MASKDKQAELIIIKLVAYLSRDNIIGNSSMNDCLTK